MGFGFQRPGVHLLKILLLNGQQPSALSQVCKQKSLEVSPANRPHMCTFFTDAADRCRRCASCGLENLQGHNFRTMCIGVHLFLTWRGRLVYLQSPFELPQRRKPPVRRFLRGCVNCSCRFCNNSYKESEKNLLNSLNRITYSKSAFF